MKKTCNTFCQQCSMVLLGIDCKDLAGITTVAQLSQGRAAIVKCLGCGTIQVDTQGKCLTHGEHANLWNVGWKTKGICK